MTRLYHVGCGTYLFDLEAAHSMALACRCGAGSPIVTPDIDVEVANSPVRPSSLWVIELRSGSDTSNLPHLEYYLGFSDFNCPAKVAWERHLRNLGLTPFSECDQGKCREEPQRFAERERFFSRQVQP